MGIDLLRLTLDLCHLQSMLQMVLLLLWAVRYLTVLWIIVAPVDSISTLVYVIAVSLDVLANPVLSIVQVQRLMVFSGRLIWWSSINLLTYIKQGVLAIYRRHVVLIDLRLFTSLHLIVRLVSAVLTWRHKSTNGTSTLEVG